MYEAEGNSEAFHGSRNVVLRQFAECSIDCVDGLILPEELNGQICRTRRTCQKSQMTEYGEGIAANG